MDQKPEENIEQLENQQLVKIEQLAAHETVGEVNGETPPVMCEFILGADQEMRCKWCGTIQPKENE